jgi:hypothetical protein
LPDNDELEGTALTTFGLEVELETVVGTRIGAAATAVTPPAEAIATGLVNVAKILP